MELTLKTPIKLSAIVNEAPVFDRVFKIPVEVENVVIYESPVMQYLVKEGHDYLRSLRSTCVVEYSPCDGPTALPIFKGDRIEVYTGDLGIAHVQSRDAHIIELLNEKGDVRAVYKRGEDR